MLKIFCVYFDRRPLWKSDCVEPIQAGRSRTGIDLGMLADDTGDSISGENARYGEMTAWYWVWKNYLPAHSEIEYVGFSHYRRFLDFADLSKGRTYRTAYWKFRKVFDHQYTEEKILAKIKDADLTMRMATESGFATMREQYLDAHPENIEDFDRFVSLIRERHPAHAAEIDAALGSGMLSMELQFVMKRKLFLEFMDWTFSLCREFEQRWKWSGSDEGDQARAPAFLVERLFMVWLAMCRKSPEFKVIELPLVKLNGRPWWYCLLKPFLAVLPESVDRKVYKHFK